MSLYSEIHKEQTRLAIKRQPSLHYVLQSLVSELQVAGVAHPFDTGRVPSKLSSSNGWLHPPSLCCCVPNPHTVYRIVPMRRLFGARDLNWIKSFDPRRFTTEGSLRAFLATLPHTDGWIRLSTLAKGELVGYRGKTWWSDENPTKGQLIDHAYRRGMPNEWIAADTLILRVQLPSPSIELCVPSAIDGFHSPVFLPVPEKPRPGGGRAVDIGSDKALLMGCREFVATTIPADGIDLRAMDVPAHTKRQGRTLPELESYLLSYYRSLE